MNLNDMNPEAMPHKKIAGIPSYLEEYESDIGIGHVVELRLHNPRYKEIFSKERDRITSAFGQLPISLHHVGSTSVEGLYAKPIIDILLTYPESVPFENVKQALTDQGYIFRDDLLPNRTYFVLENDDKVRYFSITVCMSDDAQAKEILAFRDNLRQNSSILDEYAAIKRRLSGETANRQDYTNQKSAFIQQYSKQRSSV